MQNFSPGIYCMYLVCIPKDMAECERWNLVMWALKLNIPSKISYHLPETFNVWSAKKEEHKFNI